MASDMFKRLTNMRGVTAWMFILGAVAVALIHKETATGVMTSAAAVAIAFIGGSVAAEWRGKTSSTEGE